MIELNKVYCGDCFAKIKLIIFAKVLDYTKIREYNYYNNILL